MHEPSFDLLSARLAQQGIAINTVLRELQDFPIETPSWGYGNSGTRF